MAKRSTTKIGPRDIDILMALDRCPLTVAQMLTLSSTFTAPFRDESNLRRRLRALARGGFVIATHGEAFAGVPDATNIRLGRDQSGLMTRLHYNDVLSLDLSSVSLVLLSVCMSKYGIQWANDEDLSLAWAFRAAGAKSVVASRWKVPDAAAWYFSHHFYDAMIKEKMAVRESFRHAIYQTRNQTLFKASDVWGTFSLLD